MQQKFVRICRQIFGISGQQCAAVTKWSNRARPENKIFDEDEKDPDNIIGKKPTPGPGRLRLSGIEKNEK